MLFNSLEFLIFFPCVVFLYYLVPKKFQYILLLAASYIFYMWWNVKYVLLIAFVTFITYIVGIIVEREKGRLRKICITVCIVVLLLVLIFFKYWYFVIDSINGLIRLFDGERIKSGLDIILPVGISFYTFQAIGYVVDVYKNRIQCEKNILRYALFISFFPQLVAGPIERSGNLLKQLKYPKNMEWKKVEDGILLMLWGFFQKLVVADRIAIIVDTVYSNYDNYSGSIYIFATVLFAMQIYCDFGGYSCIAIGAAKVLGISLINNFKQPYFAISIQDFWRRWHISLSEWFRDYVYIPLGGSRNGIMRKYSNLFITFLLSGLWHGASWNFVMWGGLHGCYQIIGDIKNQIKKYLGFNNNLEINNCFIIIVKRIVTFAFVTFAWLFFRVDKIETAFAMIKRVFFNFNLGDLFNGTVYNMGWGRLQVIGIVFCCGIVLSVDYFHEKNISIIQKLEQSTVLKRWSIWYALILYILVVIVQTYGNNASAFIYFQF